MSIPRTSAHPQHLLLSMPGHGVQGQCKPMRFLSTPAHRPALFFTVENMASPNRTRMRVSRTGAHYSQRLQIAGGNVAAARNVAASQITRLYSSVSPDKFHKYNEKLHKMRSVISSSHGCKQAAGLNYPPDAEVAPPAWPQG